MKYQETSSGSSEELFQSALEALSPFKSYVRKGSSFWIKDQETLSTLSSENREYSGYLSKQSSLLAIKSSRFFIFTPTHILYKKKECSKEILGAAPLDYLTVELFPERFCFLLRFESRKSKIFAKTEAEFSQIQSILAKKCVFKASFQKCYSFESQIQRGGFGDVWRVTRKIGGKPFAAKIIPKCYLDSTIREITALRKLAGLPHIVVLEEVHESETHFILLFELIEGGSLRSVLKTQGRFKRKEAWKFLQALLRALKSIHDSGFVHRDLKPDNILLRKQDDPESVVLIDFGLAFQNGSPTSRCVGTAGYMAPEIFNHEPYDEKIDVYSTGAIFFNAITGEKLFHGSSVKEIMSQNRNSCVHFYRVLMFMRSLEEERELVLKMLVNSPKERISLDEALEYRPAVLQQLLASC